MDLFKNPEHKRVVIKATKGLVAQLELKLQELPEYKDYKVALEALQELEGKDNDTVGVKDDFITKFSRYGKYNPLWTASKKAEFVLRQLGIASTTTIIVNTILKFEPTKDRNSIVSLISAVLGKQSKKGKMFTRAKNDLDEYVYGLMEWDNKENKLPLGNEEQEEEVLQDNF